LLIGHGWDRYPGMDRCLGKDIGRSYLHANRLLSFRY
jgi:hypothetical protein